MKLGTNGDLANFNSSENHVFYWVYDVGRGGGLAKEFRQVRDVPYPYPYPYRTRRTRNPYPSRTCDFAYRPASKHANRALLLKLAKWRLANIFGYIHNMTCKKS